jgi:hypothetical protein
VACCLIKAGGIKTERKAVDSAQNSESARIEGLRRQMIQANPATDFLPCREEPEFKSAPVPGALGDLQNISPRKCGTFIHIADWLSYIKQGPVILLRGTAMKTRLKILFLPASTIFCRSVAVLPPLACTADLV